MFESYLPIVSAIITSIVIGGFILLTLKWHGSWSLDHAIGVQKFHQQPTPRIGGLAVMGGCLMAFLVNEDRELINTLRPILVCAMIPFFFGFREDVTKHGSVFQRLLASAVAAVAVIWLTGIYINRLDMWVVDDLLHVSWIAVLLTLFAVAGLTNAINILDGFNGLASGVACIILIVFAGIALQLGDADLAEIALILSAAILGFMVFNYPFGKLFLGDSGAYFIGFMLSWIAILLPIRNPQVSPWACLLICAYPVWEAVFSMYRRSKNKSKATVADNLHLHSLIKKNILRRYFKNMPFWVRNSLVAPSIWLVNIFLCGFAFYFVNHRDVLQMCFFVFVAVYIFIYRFLLNKSNIAPSGDNSS